MNRRLRRISFAVLALTLSISTQLFARCGKERWSVKTGTDSSASQVDLTNPQNTTIASLVQLSPPHPIPPDSRVAPTETTVWVVTATLTDYKHETGSTGDDDYHLVLDDGQGNTLVAEIPSPTCVADSSPFSAQIANARAEFDSQFTASSSFQTANVQVQVTGVGMFDFAHGQRGAAPNVIELHPVLDIVFNPSTTNGGGGPDFALSVPSSTIHLPQGGSSSIAVSASSTAAGGAAPNVTFSITGLPSGVTPHITKVNNGQSTISLSASTAAPTGTFPFTVTGTGNGKSHSQAVTLSVSSAAQPPPSSQQWEYQIVTAASDQELTDKANQLGADDWEMVGIVRQGTNGWKAVFKRLKRDF
jgi:hypothetical protein